MRQSFYQAPCKALAPYIDRYLGWETSGQHDLPMPQVLPGAGMELVFHYGDSTMIIMATLQAKTGKEQDVETALRALIPQVQTEETTLAYALHKAEETPGKFLFYEEYPDKNAFDMHLATPYLTNTLEHISPLLDGEPVIESYEKLGAIVR